jgi:hypothetical protein
LAEENFQMYLVASVHVGWLLRRCIGFCMLTENMNNLHSSSYPI